MPLGRSVHYVTQVNDSARRRAHKSLATERTMETDSDGLMPQPQPLPCERCSSPVRLLYKLLDAQKDKTVRVHKCDACGKYRWED